MLNVINVHNEVYDLLESYWIKDHNIRFTLRKSNRDGKLDKGYWFYGNEVYLAVSFWTGMDWKNKTPNIIFVIPLDNSQTSLEINTSDSDTKRDFVTKYLVERLGLQSSGRRYIKKYNGNYLQALDTFLQTEKITIDNIISEHSANFFKEKNNVITFISDTDFQEQKTKVESYRNSLERKTYNVTKEQIDEPIKIKDILIENYGPINSLHIHDIPFSSGWIFLTGENGTGKTSILRAIAASISQKEIDIEELPFETQITYYTSAQNNKTYKRYKNEDISSDFPIITTGFACYGPSRLRTKRTGLNSKSFDSISIVENILSSLFDEGNYLIDLQCQFKQWQEDKTQQHAYEKRKSFITEILVDILPNLYNINFNDTIDGTSKTTYIEKDKEGAEFRKVTFDKLASGLKSMIAMIGDILIRFYDQQPYIYDPAEFTGIVLIDEIDIHLHPKQQKLIVQQLNKTFPKIQFIVSTHSPIPLLGAPKNSRIFKIERTLENGVSATRLDEKLELGDLLPNTILTSPIFDLQDIIPDSHDSKKMIRTENNYNDIVFSEKIREIINSFLTDEKEQELINLFKSRRK